jgi:ABC-type lipoprotein release transport system permease subunit
VNVKTVAFDVQAFSGRTRYNGRMSFFSLLVRNLLYHLRGNAAVFLGVALGSAVLTGALLVGDSLRGSLRSLALDQLGWVEHALTPGRFFRQERATAFAPAKTAPAILLNGSAAAGAESVGKVQIVGVDDTFWPNGDDADFWRSSTEEIVLNRTLADHLGVKANDTVTLRLAKVEHGPRETLLGKRNARDLEEEWPLKVRRVLPDDGMGRFSLRPSPQPVRNAFVPLALVQESLKLKGRVNALLIGKTSGDPAAILASTLTLDDWNLKLTTPQSRADSFIRYLDPKGDGTRVAGFRWKGRVPDALAAQADGKGFLTREAIAGFYQKHRPYWTVESTQMFLESAVEDAVKVAARHEKIDPPTPVLIYLADSLKTSDGSWERPYAVLAGVPTRQIPHDVGKNEVHGNEIYLTDWSLPTPPPTQLELSYYVPDARNELQLQTKTVRVKGVVPLEGAADDPDWTPEFPGITDQANMRSWEKPPFPYDPERVSKLDEKYWERYKTAPKAYLSLKTAQDWWASRYGQVTSLRLNPGDWQLADSFRKTLEAKLEPAAGGFVVQPVRELSLQAGGGSTDFGGLFLAFSFFLIVSALLLVGLLVRLNLDRRAREMGLLLATGWSHGQIRRLLLGEGLLLTLFGAGLGILGARYYADAMLELLRRNWPGGGSLAFLKTHATTLSYAIGYGASVVVGMLTMWWAVRGLAKLTPRSLLAGNTSGDELTQRGPSGRSFWVMLASALGALASLAAAFFVTGHEAQAGSFFGAGFLLLTAFLTFVWRRLKSSGGRSDPQPTLGKLAVRNAGRNPLRSLLTAGLLAAATFLIVAVQAFHKETGADFAKTTGGSGGFPLLVESDIPFFQNFNDADVRAALFRRADPKENARAQEQLKTLEGVRVYPCRIQPGDDASCLNLYQPLKPRVLGAPASLIERGGFAFAGHVAPRSDTERDNPWTLLDRTFEDDAIPAILDANSAMWILKVGLGDTIEVKDDQGAKRMLRVVGLLKESIFQSEVLVAESNFLRLYPRQEGFQFFLVDTAGKPPESVRKALQDGMVTQGWNVSATRDRLQAYLEVENTYLATFQALGGLGLLLGALGLAIVLVRGVWERRAELALMRALGFEGAQLGRLVLYENVCLLLLGLLAGTAAALLAVAPHLLGAGANVLWGQLGVLLGLVLLTGLAAGSLAVLRSLRTPVLTALRRE